ncbi:MAG: Ku protein, partial [Chloroflexi bacterium]|nr:Ku protein [Chloroflexota bacterium]
TELEIALKLIDMLSTKWDAETFADEYREALMDRITAKIEGREFVEAKAPAPAEAVDLVAALKASIEAAEKSAGDSGAETESEPAPAANKAPKKKATRKRKVAAKP